MIRPIITTALGIADMALDVVCVLRVYRSPTELPSVLVGDVWQPRGACSAANEAVDNGLALADAIRGLIGGGR